MISVVIPLFDEAETLDQLHRELVELGVLRGYELQIIMVDDGSTDGSWQAVQRLSEQDPREIGRAHV